MLRWLIEYLAQAGPTHSKHGGGVVPTTKSSFPAHPLLSFIVYYSIVLPGVFSVHDTFFLSNALSDAEDIRQHEETIQRQAYISRFIFAYTLILFSARIASAFNAGRLRQHAVLYELTWLCNSTLLMGSISFGLFDDDDKTTTNWIFKRRPLVATACCVSVSIDQVLWYVDSVGYFLLGKFPIGVMKYLTWKQTSWIERLTCLHHFWTIPLFIYLSKNELKWNAFIFSNFIGTIHVCLSRWLTPPYIQAIKSKDGDERKQKHKADVDGMKGDPHKYRYLNVNLSHELWRDIKFSFLQISHDEPSGCLYLWRLLWRIAFFNFLLFVGILSPLSRIGL